MSLQDIDEDTRMWNDLSRLREILPDEKIWQSWRQRVPEWAFANYTPFRSFRFVITLMYTGVIGGVAYINWLLRCGHRVFGTGGAGLGVIVLGLLGLEWLEQRRYNYETPAPMAVLLLIVRMVLFEGVVALDCSNFSLLLYALIPFSLYFTFGPGLSALFTMFYGLVAIKRAWEANPFWYMNKETISFLISFALILFFMQGLARVIRRDEETRREQQRLLSELEASHRALQLYATEVAELAATEERNRLARDIHDSLGHYLTAVNIQLEKALAYMGRNPAEATQAVQDAKQAAAEALEDVRRSVGTLREGKETTSLRSALTDLAEGASRGSLEVTLQISGQEEGYSRSVLMTLFRAAQEGLTNVQRHAQATQAVLRVHLGEETATLTLRDNGRGLREAGESASDAGGYGLQGIRERVELVSGEMTVDSLPQGGAALTLSVPKNPARLTGGRRPERPSPWPGRSRRSQGARS